MVIAQSIGSRRENPGACGISSRMRRLSSILGRVTGRSWIAAGAIALIYLAGAAGAWAAGQGALATPTPLQQVTNSTDIVRLVQSWVSQNQIWLWVAYLSITAAVGLGLYRFRTTDLARRLRRTLEDEVLTNWRLTMLGITSLALTLASGWTTWDGMTNFTGTPLLSFLITVGIQGVMLIAAWLIGESFAIGLAALGVNGRMSAPDVVLAALSILLLAGVFYALAMAGTYHGTIEAIDGILRRHKSELALPIPTENLRVLIALGVSGLLTLLIVTQKEVFEPYFRGIKVILKGLPIWVMFLSCMITSVFFSFDSLFSTIFPLAERERAAQLRTTNQVAGIVGDLGATITKRQAEAIDALFASPQWATYSGRINDIITIARDAPDQIAELARKELEDQQSKRAGQQERKASAESQQVRLDKHKDELLGDVNKLKEEVPPLAAEVDRLKGEIFNKDSEILVKKAEAQAEAGGVGGTLKAGEGPVWQQRRKEMDDLGKLKAILEGQLGERVAQLKSKRDKIASSEAELAQVDGEIGKLKGEIDVADKQIAVTSAALPGAAVSATTQTAANGGFKSLEDAFAQFRQRPERSSYDAIQQQCGGMLAVFDRVPAIKATAQAAAVRCDPSVVAEPVARILTLNDGLAAYKARCAKPDSLPQSSVDDLLQFGQECVQSSGLGGQDTVLYRSQINSIGLNRDDKAHRFVVSWNAFLDGNRLAYLALLVAIALDGLVFMSGLFGANATSSPLVRLPAASRRTASDLEATMYAALRPDIYGRSRLIINALHPIRPHDGFVAEIRLSEHERDTAASIRSVLSMAGQFGAVRPDRDDPDVYMVRGELTEFLSKACERELRINPKVQEAAEAARAAEAERHVRFERERQGEVENQRKQSAKELQEERELQRRAKALEPVLSAALIPERIDDKEALFHQATKVLAQMRPVSERTDFSSMIEIRGERADDVTMRSVLNVAAARKAVQRDAQAEGEVYLLRPEFTLCLTAIRVKAYEDWQRRSNRARLFPWLRPREEPPTYEARAQDETQPRRALPPPPDPRGSPALLENANGAGAKPQDQRATSSPNGHDSRIDSGPGARAFAEGLRRSYVFAEAEWRTLQAIVDNGWTYRLDNSLSSLGGIGRVSQWMTKAVSEADTILIELDGQLGLSATELRSPGVERYREAYRVLCQLTTLQDYLRQPSDIGSVATVALEKAVDKFLIHEPRSLADLEAAIQRFESNPGDAAFQRTAGIG